MKTKSFKSQIKIPDDAEAGEFIAVFSKLNVKDHDGDVTLPGAFKEGQKVRISYWGHRWQDLPVGIGHIHSDDEKAWVEGKFFTDTVAGMETYKTVKNLEDLQEWSYGFDVEDAEPGVKDGENVNFLRSLYVHEVSPVMLGAGIDTHTQDIKNKKDNEDPDEKQNEETPTTEPEDEAGDSKSSMVTPQVVLTLIDINTLEVS